MKKQIWLNGPEEDLLIHALNYLDAEMKASATYTAHAYARSFTSKRIAEMKARIQEGGTIPAQPAIRTEQR